MSFELNALFTEVVDGRPIAGAKPLPDGQHRDSSDGGRQFRLVSRELGAVGAGAQHFRAPRIQMGAPAPPSSSRALVDRHFLAGEPAAADGERHSMCPGSDSPVRRDSSASRTKHSRTNGGIGRHLGSSRQHEDAIAHDIVGGDLLDVPIAQHPGVRDSRTASWSREFLGRYSWTTPISASTAGPATRRCSKAGLWRRVGQWSRCGLPGAGV